jgi:hypothetical protein
VPRIVRLTGIYNADGTLRAELAYAIGRRLGRRHCALCDVTHGRVREKAEWREARERLGVPFETVHLDERTPEVREASGGRAPVVLAHLDDGTVVELLGPEEIEACGGDPDALVDVLVAVAQARRLELTAALPTA